MAVPKWPFTPASLSLSTLYLSLFSLLSLSLRTLNLSLLSFVVFLYIFSFLVGGMGSVDLDQDTGTWYCHSIISCTKRSLSVVLHSFSTDVRWPKSNQNPKGLQLSKLSDFQLMFTWFPTKVHIKIQIIITIPPTHLSTVIVAILFTAAKADSLKAVKARHYSTK